MRPCIQSLLSAAMNGEFDILLCEALDRLSRDQEDIAGIYKRMEFASVKIITLSEGEISTLHIGLKGTMNAMFLKDLADKTRRGLRGRVEKGKSGGGIAYGYKVVKKFNSEGEAIRGDREIDEQQAKIVRRIFHEYALENKSPRAIASDLNGEGIPCPSGKAWGQSTINGNRRRGTGILNNNLYIGEMIWNRQRFIKDPDTGRRVTRLNDEADWIRHQMPDLRIISQGLWDGVKLRQKALDQKNGHLGARKRPAYLLSGLLKCGACGGGFAKINVERYGCSQARNKGKSVCANKKTIRRDKIEALVLKSLKTHLMRDDLIEIFCAEYARHMNSLRSAHNAALTHQKSDMAKLAREKENIITAIKDGVPASMVKDELEQVSVKLEELAAAMKNQAQEARPLIHPSMARRYREQIDNLRKLLEGERSGEAREHVRETIEKIVLTPKEGKSEMVIDLYGSLAGILKIATEDKSMKNRSINEKRLAGLVANDNYSSEPSVQLVAGAGCQRYLAC